ncbi:MAG: hypothetical protein GEV10_20240 [Streptosporangiales bacterium]|nr:hypothetical protein [Streptosporangiales bacterium]
MSGTTGDETGKDPFEERLRAALTSAADDVTPRGDGLARIRGRISEGKGSWWARTRDTLLARPAFAAASSVGVIALGLVTAVAIGQVSGVAQPFGGGSSPSAAGTTAGSTQTTSASPTDEPSHSASTHTSEPSDSSTGPPPPATVSVPVYFISRTSGGYELTQSSRTVTVHGTKRERQTQRAEAAFSAIYETNPQARSANVWQSGTTVVDTELVGDTLRVDLSGAGGSGASSSAEAARAALKQVVYTGLAAAPSASTVQVRVGGAAVSSFWGVLPIDPGGVGRGDSALTRPFNTISSPDPGATVGSPVTISGTGAYDGGQVQWQVLSGGTVVKSGSADTGTDGFGDWSRSVTLDPGSYVLETFEQAGGSRRHEESVSFTVTG